MIYLITNTIKMTLYSKTNKMRATIDKAGDLYLVKYYKQGERTPCRIYKQIRVSKWLIQANLNNCKI